MEHKDIAEVYEYIRANRGVGHTTLLKDGALNATYPYIVIGADQSHANRLAREIGNEFAIPVGINQTNKFRGINYPVLIDNHTFTTSIDSYVREIRIQREKLIILEKDIQDLKVTISKIERIPFWVRLYKARYLKRIKKIKNND